MQGFIKKVFDRGFGFIKVDDGSPDLFFHAHSLIDLVFDDAKLLRQRVEFDVEMTDRGPAAVRVRPRD